MTPIIVIPCKSLDRGKSRLQGVLDHAQRRDLCQQFLTHTIALATSVIGPQQIKIVSADGAVREIARCHEIEVLSDPGGGLNQALDHARHALMSAEIGAQAIMVLPIDLPMATPADIEAVLASSSDVTIVADEAGRGTNVLLLGVKALPTFEFSYGIDSIAAHKVHADACGHSFELLERPGLQLDVDEPADLERWIAVRGTQSEQLR